MLYTIVVCDHIHQKGLKLLQSNSQINYVYAADIDKTSLLDVIKDADVCITRSSTDVDTKFLDAAKKLKAVVRAGVGVDNVDLNECSKRGVIAMNVPTANTIAAVELTMAHMLSCARKFPYAHAQLKNDRVWKREDWYGTELYGKKLGVIGFGNIGSRVGIRSKAFGMDVIAYDPYINPSKATDVGVTYTKNFDDILACDIITIHTPKNSETTNMIDTDEIAKMKDGVIIINTSRGKLIDTESLIQKLSEGKIGGVGLDVYEDEEEFFLNDMSNSYIRDKSLSILLSMPNVVITSHQAFFTKEALDKIASDTFENITDITKTGKSLNEVKK